MGRGWLGFARRGAQHRPSRRSRGGQEPRHAGRGRVVGIRRGAAFQAARPLGHGGDAAAGIRGHGPAGRGSRPVARRGAAPAGGAAARCGPGIRGRRPARGATGGSAPLRAHPARRARGPEGPRVRGRPARGARRVRRGTAPREPYPGRARGRRARRAGDAGRRRVRAVRRRVHRAAPSPRRLRRGHAPYLLPGDRRRSVRVAGRPARSATRLMPLLDGFDLPALAQALGALGADGWLLYDFRKLNPIAGRILGDTGMGTRRLFVLLPRAGRPIAVVHRIELQTLADFPGEVRPYGAWRELHGHLEALVSGRTLAIEISPRDQVPYLDRVPYGVVQLLESFGARLVSSAPLVSRFAARWSAAELAGHRKAAEILAAVAREALTGGGGEAGRGTDVRGAAGRFLRERWGPDGAMTGAQVDDAARAVIRDAGLAEYFVHRTGHSIDRDLHGSGPHIDNFETEDARALVPGVGFSIEPGVYLPGRFGMRSEINVYIDTAGPEVNPSRPQDELILV